EPQASACAAPRGLKPAALRLKPADLRSSDYFATGAMIGRVTGAGAVVNLVTAAELSATVQVRVRWADTPDDLPSAPDVSPVVVSSTPWERIELLISGLQPNGRYYYLVQYETSDEPGLWRDLPPAGEFATQKTAGQAFSFCLMADAHWGQPVKVVPGSPARWNGEQCLDRILVAPAGDFLVDLGDSAHPIGIAVEVEAVQRYVDWRAVMAPLTRKMPVYMALGNHEQEAGFYQRGPAEPPAHLWNGLSSEQYHQLWATAARLKCIPNPRCDTYPEGGEGAPGYDSIADWWGDDGPWNNGAPMTDLQNFYAWTWGDALFVALDPFRYTLVGSGTVTNSPSQWTLGPTQLRWLEDVLAASAARWKFVLAHHQVGGGLINVQGDAIPDGGDEQAYARGSANEATRPGTEQALVHELMLRYGVQFFMYGHEHAFCHSVKDGVNYLCCGRPTFLNRWWSRGGMRASYGSIVNAQPSVPWVNALLNVLGYTRIHVSAAAVTVEWIRTGYSFVHEIVPIAQARRDWLESWLGWDYPLNPPPTSPHDPPAAVDVTMVPTDVDGVRTRAGATLFGYFEQPLSTDYYVQPEPVRPEDYNGKTIPLQEFPEALAAVDTVPELVYAVTWSSSTRR
ncbi:MAG: metallophosphoesterase, partial [Planctomycetes bacterium]|nr:metallophosphoesterase [Planctomycetota bacterium]